MTIICYMKRITYLSTECLPPVTATKSVLFHVSMILLFLEKLRKMFINGESRKMQKWLGPIARYDSSMAWRWAMKACQETRSPGFNSFLEPSEY